MYLSIPFIEQWGEGSVESKGVPSPVTGTYKVSFVMIFIICRVALPHSKFAACSIPFSRILLYSVSSEQIFRIRANISSLLLGLKYKAESLQISGKHVASDVSTGTPDFIASKGGRPKPSANDGNTNK